VVDQIFEVLVRDFARFAQQLHAKPSSTEAQMACCLRLIRKPVPDAARAGRVWREHVLALAGAYQMTP
jgi:acyl-CoA dehydrogenase